MANTNGGRAVRAVQQTSEVPTCLTDAWRIDRDVYSDECYEWQGSGELESWSVVALMTLFLRTSKALLLTPDEPSHPNSNGEVNGEDKDPIEPPEVVPHRGSAALRARLMHRELPYSEQRQLMTLCGMEADMEKAIDAAILNGEIHIRARGSDNKDGKYLVSLPDLLKILCPRAVPEGAPPAPDTIVYHRKQPVEAAITVLNELRPSELQLHVSDQSFAATFARITKNILHGLDWRNVVVAGGMVLTTLLHVDPAHDQDKRVQDLDLDIYIHGLSQAAAQRKAFEIEEVWRRNLPDDNAHILVTQNHKTITFIPSYPNRRLQIILKALPNLSAILLNFDLDICALAFDGSNVLMLPRCARAIETGYSMFTMDLIWGTHLSDRRSTQEARVLKYADRGFGIRFLPSYENLLKVSRTFDEVPWCGDEAFESVNLEEIASAAYRFVSDMAARRERIARSFQLPVSKIVITADDLSQSFPTAGRKGLDNFELFMRHCEAWRLDACHKITYDRAGTNGSYDPTLYEDTPTYKWDENFHPQALIGAIDEAAIQLGTAVQSVLDSRWIRRVEDHPGLYLGRQVYGSDLASVLRQSLVIPVFMPRLPLDIGYLQIDPRLQNMSHSYSPAIVKAMQSRLQTSLVGVNESQEWDLQFWFILGGGRWEGADREWDGIVELMWSLHKWFKTASQASNTSSNWSDFHGALEVARRYRRRFILPDVPLHHPTSTARLLSRLPTLRESLLFRAWVKRSPPDSMRNRPTPSAMNTA